MNAYKLSCDGGAGTTRVYADLHMLDDKDAIDFAKRSCIPDIAKGGRYYRFALWMGERLVAAWNTEVTVEFRDIPIK